MLFGGTRNLSFLFPSFYYLLPPVRLSYTNRDQYLMVLLVIGYITSSSSTFEDPPFPGIIIDPRSGFCVSLTTNVVVTTLIGDFLSLYIVSCQAELNNTSRTNMVESTGTTSYHGEDISQIQDGHCCHVGDLIPI